MSAPIRIHHAHRGRCWFQGRRHHGMGRVRADLRASPWRAPRELGRSERRCFTRPRRRGQGAGRRLAPNDLAAAALAAGAGRRQPCAGRRGLQAALRLTSASRRIGRRRNRPPWLADNGNLCWADARTATADYAPLIRPTLAERWAWRTAGG